MRRLPGGVRGNPGPAERPAELEQQFRRLCAAAGAGLYIERLPHIINAGRIIVGDHVHLWGSSNIEFSNIARRDPELRIGSYTYIGQCSFNIAHSIVIGEHCLVASGVHIQDLDGHPLDAELRRAGNPTPPEGIKPVRIGDVAWIGRGALILKGVTVGERAVVAAMSMVAEDVPADTLVAGNPARAVKLLNRRQQPGSPETMSPIADKSSHDPLASMPAAHNAIETRIKKVVAELARLSPSEIDVTRWVDCYGIDSLRLLLLRESLEGELDVHFSDSIWLSFRSMAEIADYTWRRKSERIYPLSPVTISAPQTAQSPPAYLGRRYTRSGGLYADIEIGMPLTGRNNLAEGPLLQHLGALRWAHLSELSGVRTRNISDAEGNRLYATFFFVDVQFPANRPMASYTPDDRIKAAGDLRRFGTSMLDGSFYLLPPDTLELDEIPSSKDPRAWSDVPRVRLSNVFVMQLRDAEHLQQSRPANLGFQRIPEMADPPDSYLLVKDAEREGHFAPPPEDYTRLTPAPVSVRHKLDPDRDVNGAGLVYFAHYPVFLDIAERQVLQAAGVPLSEKLINRRTLLRRRGAYLGNASAFDTLLIEVEPWIDSRAEPTRLWVNFRMRRVSDGRLMMISTAEKAFVTGQ
jgi:probable biosynthetic protein (TIGR04098 family)